MEHLTSDSRQSEPRERVAKPVWKRWFCVADDLYWDGADRACWFCGAAGTAVHAPRLTSQHGFDPDLVA